MLGPRIGRYGRLKDTGGICNPNHQTNTDLIELTANGGCLSLKFCFFHKPEHKYCYKVKVSKSNKNKPLNGLTDDANIQNKESPHIYVRCNLNSFPLKSYI